ncbi:MAG: ribbon-helix-helix protein, CopG family [Gammaproteobacteria bacterium]
MAIPTVKSTYSLDLGSVRTLEELARRWGVSKSEALRRAIRAAGGTEQGKESAALKALAELQQSLKLSSSKASAWANQARSERRTASARHEPRRA